MITAQGPFFVKFPADVLDYTPSWATFLGTDTIASSTWNVPAGLSNSGQDFDGTSTQIFLSGGTAGAEYELTNTIVTTGGRTKSRSFFLQIASITLASNALITLEYLKTHLKRYTNYPEEDLENPLFVNLINSISARMERYCNRVFKAANYIERTTLDQEIKLRQYPVLYVDSVYVDTQDAFTLINAAVNKVKALAWVAGRKLYLRVVGGASNGLESIDLTASGSDTLSELRTTINNLSTGWNATLAMGRTGYELCDDLIESVGQRILPNGTALQMLGDPTDQPLSLDAAAGIVCFQVDPFDDPRQWEPYSELSVRTNWDSGAQRQGWIKYRAGFETIPADLQALTARMIAHVFTTPQDASINFEQFGDYSYWRSVSKEVDQSVLSFTVELEEWKSQAI